MEKTILSINKELSIIILSGIAILFTFVSGYAPVTSLISFCFVFIKALVFVIVPLSFYLLERENLEFKKIAGIYTGYFIVNVIITIIASVSLVRVVPSLWKLSFDLINLVILLSGLFIIVEQILICLKMQSKVYHNTIMKIVYLVGTSIAYPFIVFIEKKIKTETKE